MEFSIFCIFDHFPNTITAATYMKNFAQLVERAEALGFDRVWVSEHHFTEYGGIQPRPQMTLAHVAARTRSIRLGTAVTLVPFDNPVRLAEDFALLDVLSEGRVDWGVGRGLFPFEYDGMGVSQDESRTRLEEHVDFVRRAWSEEKLRFKGKFTDFEGLDILPRPVQQPHPPIYAAALSPASTDWVAKHGFNNLQVPYVAPLEVSDDRLATWRAGVKAAGHAHEPKLTAMVHTYVGDTTASARGEAESRLNDYLALQANHFPTEAKSKEYEIYAKMSDSVKALNAAELIAGDRVAIGDVDEVGRVVGHMRDRFDLDEYCCFVNWGAMPHELTLQSIERFAKDVIPRFR